MVERKSCEAGAGHRGPIFQVVLLAQETSRGKGAKWTARRILRKTVGHCCSDCLATREFTAQGRDLMPGRARGA